MRRSTDRILTSHAGSLPRPEGLLELNRRGADGASGESDARAQEFVVDVVRRQLDCGIDVINDGEFGHAMTQAVDYGAWWTYVFERLGGLELGQLDRSAIQRKPKPGDPRIGGLHQRRDRRRFADAYGDPAAGITLGAMPAKFPEARGPIRYRGHEAVRRDIRNLQAAMHETGAEEGFLNAVGPGSCMRFSNAFYETDDELLWACAEALREEYTAIVDAGLVVQIDDPAVAENWDTMDPAPTAEEYRRYTARIVEAINHAIRGLPQDRIRFHLCWGSWHGPHTTDIPMADIVDTMLAIDAGAYSFEAGNVRHEHEWAVWRDAALPEGKVLLPGVVSHATNVVEHPQLVADRIVRFAEVVGREHVIAGTDCGLGGRVHPQIAWAKLEALAEGAELATRRLWGQGRSL